MGKLGAHSGRDSRAGSATAGQRRRSRWPMVLALAALVAAALLYLYREPITGYAGAGAAYSARVACSCRFVAGRDLDDCAKDKLPGMELITLSEDAEAQSVTARFPLIKSETATYRKGYGCMLETWED